MDLVTSLLCKEHCYKTLLIKTINLFAKLKVEYINLENISKDDSAKVLKKSPTETIPLLQVGDHYLSGTKAIIKYMVSSNKEIEEVLMQTNLSFESASIEMWVDFTVNNIWVLLETIIQESKVENSRILAEAKKELFSVLEIINSHLKFQTYLVGSSMTLADLFMACSLKLIVSDLLKREELKHMNNVIRWYKLISSGKEFKEVYGELKLKD